MTFSEQKQLYMIYVNETFFSVSGKTKMSSILITTYFFSNGDNDDVLVILSFNILIYGYLVSFTGMMNFDKMILPKDYN